MLFCWWLCIHLIEIYWTMLALLFHGTMFVRQFAVAQYLREGSYCTNLACVYMWIADVARCSADWFMALSMLAIASSRSMVFYVLDYHHLLYQCCFPSTQHFTTPDSRSNYFAPGLSIQLGGQLHHFGSRCSRWVWDHLGLRGSETSCREWLGEAL